jgi:nucleoside-diphosphate-sugar epimerase
LDPAIKGTLNVLTAAKEVGVKRVVVTSSISAITPSPDWPSDVVKREDCWTDVEYCKKKEVFFLSFLLYLFWFFVFLGYHHLSVN